MKYKFCSIRINVTKYDVTFVTKGDPTPPPPCGYDTEERRYLASQKMYVFLAREYNHI